jgi:hypothetical protein
VARRFPLATALVLACLAPTASSAAEIDWVSFSTWTSGATSGSVTYKGGSLGITVTGGPSGFVLLQDHTIHPFATTSANYENIDTATHNVFDVQPVRVNSVPGNDWSIEFDFVGTTLTSADVFTIGQLFRTSTGRISTSITLSVFGADDTTPLLLTDLAFEQHTITTTGFGNVLGWDPSTGTLIPTLDNNENSGWGFFSPTSGEIGKIVIAADTPVGGSSDLIQFGMGVPVPELSTGLLMSLGIAGLAAYRRRKI